MAWCSVESTGMLPFTFTFWSSEFCRHNPLCYFSTSVYCRYFIMTQSGNFWIHPRISFAVGAAEHLSITWSAQPYTEKCTRLLHEDSHLLSLFVPVLNWQSALTENSRNLMALMNTVNVVLELCVKHNLAGITHGTNFRTRWRVMVEVEREMPSNRDWFLNTIMMSLGNKVLLTVKIWMSYLYISESEILCFLKMGRSYYKII
jgi:hypothetical protein